LPRAKNYRRNFLSQEETFGHKKKLPANKKLLFTGRNFLGQEETNCHSKKPTLTVRNFMSHEEAFKG
jgi:hypothetical protein